MDDKRRAWNEALKQATAWKGREKMRSWMTVSERRGDNTKRMIKNTRQNEEKEKRQGNDKRLTPHLQSKEMEMHTRGILEISFLTSDF